MVETHIQTINSQGIERDRRERMTLAAPIPPATTLPVSATTRVVLDTTEWTRFPPSVLWMVCESRRRTSDTDS